MAVDSNRIRTCLKKIQDDPYDLESWSLVIKDAQSKRIDDSRDTFERLVSYFPNSGRYWKVYIEQEMKARNYEKVEKLFQRSLMKVLNIDLWKTYLTYVKETKASLPNYKEKMAQAYDFALDKMGMDIASFSLWNDYVTFLKGVEAVGNYAENQKIMAIRKVYHRGIVNPMINIEQLWKSYILFEQTTNPIIAEKMTAERSRDYMNSRRVAKEYEACTRGLVKSAPCIPPSGSQDELRQVELWQKYISWEKSNPMRVEDQALITKRVMFAFEQALLCLGHHPNIWYEAAVFLQDSARELNEKGDVDASKMCLEQASAFYERATSTILKKSMLLHFAYADFEEQQVKFEKVHQVYKNFLEIEEIDPTLCYVQYMKFCRRAEGASQARIIFKKAREDPRSSHHVYVAAALMEYYCTKDKKIANNVFELGFKKFKDNEEYIMAYIDYLSHQNEDNNTRVLFERALTSGSLKPEQQIDIWNKFLEFESNIGDMASIIKVEKRRAAALQEETEINETTQLIDRYRFLALYPCSKEELTQLGYKQLGSMNNESAAMSAPTITNGNSVPGSEAAHAEHDKVPRPDFNSMVPFKPKFNWLPGEHRMPGGGFPMPLAAAEFCRVLPPPVCYEGPFVIVDRLMEVFAKVDMGNELKVEVSVDSNPKQFELARSVHWTTSEGGNSNSGGSDAAAARKRKSGGNAEDSEDEDTISAPVNDLYRKRQQKKMR